VTKSFRRFQRKEKIADAVLNEAIARAERGLIDADLGLSLIKQRASRPGQGRSGGYRTVIAYRVADRAVFLFGFAKNERDNIDAADLRDLASFGAILLGLNTTTLRAAIAGGELTEIAYDDQA
jgi:hypothetical protein